MPDRRRTLATLFELLKPGGSFIASNLCLGGTRVPYGALIAVPRWFGKAPMVHLYDRETIRRELREAGFVALEEREVGGGRTVAFIVAKKPGRLHCSRQALSIYPHRGNAVVLESRTREVMAGRTSASHAGHGTRASSTAKRRKRAQTPQHRAKVESNSRAESWDESEYDSTLDRTSNELGDIERAGEFDQDREDSDIERAH